MTANTHNVIHALTFILSSLALTHLKQSLRKSYPITKPNYSAVVSLTTNGISTSTTYLFPSI